MLSLKRSSASYRRDRRGSGPMILTETAKILTQPNGKVTPDIKMAAIRLTQLALLQGARNPGSDQIGHTLLAGFPAGSTEFDAETARILAVLNLAPAAEPIMRLVETSPNHGVQLHYARHAALSQFRLDVRPKAATARLVRRDARLGGRQQPNGLRLQYRWGHDRAFHSGRPQIFRGARRGNFPPRPRCSYGSVSPRRLPTIRTSWAICLRTRRRKTPAAAKSWWRRPSNRSARASRPAAGPCSAACTTIIPIVAR